MNKKTKKSMGKRRATKKSSPKKRSSKKKILYGGMDDGSMDNVDYTK